VILSSGSDPPQQLLRVRVENNHLVLLHVHHIEEPVLRVDRQPTGSTSPSEICPSNSCLGLKINTFFNFASETKRRSSSSMARPLIQAKCALTPFLIISVACVCGLKMNTAPTFWSPTYTSPLESTAIPDGPISWNGKVFALNFSDCDCSPASLSIHVALAFVATGCE